MMMESSSSSSLLLQLHKLCENDDDDGSGGSISEATLEQVLKTLWETRRSGLKPQQKSSIQSLLNLPSPQQLDPLLACLRLLLRKCVHHNLTTADDFFNLFPPPISPHLQNILVRLLLKYQTTWKEEASRDQSPWQSSNISSSMWPPHHHSSTHINPYAAPLVADTTAPFAAPLFLQQVEGPHNLGILPRLKSITWTMQNQKSNPANRVSIVSLKLHDYTKSPSGEREVKFQLTKDTLEAMLRSMTYISKQLSNTAGASSEPLQKKPRA